MSITGRAHSWEGSYRWRLCLRERTQLSAFPSPLLLNFDELWAPPGTPLAPSTPPVLLGELRTPEIPAFWSFFLSLSDPERRGVCSLFSQLHGVPPYLSALSAARLGSSTSLHPSSNPLHPTNHHRTRFLPFFPIFHHFRAFTANRIYNASGSRSSLGLNSKYLDPLTPHPSAHLIHKLIQDDEQ